MSRLGASRGAALEPGRLDPWLVTSVFITACGLAVAIVVAISHDLLFGFGDAASHVVIPRRVFDNYEPGLAQLGVHWGPLYHALQLPLVWIDPVYRSGASGVAVSVAASLVTSVFVYRLALLAQAGRPAACLAAALLVASPSFLYVGVIPMLYATLMATATGSIYYLARWAVEGSGRHLLAAGLLLTLATLTHFDTWILGPLELAVVLAVSRAHRYPASQREATAILWGLAGAYGMFLFALMNVMIFNDPLAFTEPFSNTGDVFGTAHRGLGALLDYPLAAWLVSGPTLVLAGVLGAALFVWRWRREPVRLVPLLLFYPLAFYFVQAATSGSIIEPGQDLGDWRNLRYGSTLFPALAFFAVTGPRRPALRLIAVAAVLAGSAMMVQAGRVGAWEDAKHDVPTDRHLRDVAAWLGERHQPGKSILVPVHHYRLDRFELYTGLESGAFIDSNDTVAWRRTRERPGRLAALDVGWIAWIGVDGESIVERVVRRSGARLCHTQRSPWGSYMVRIYAVPGAVRCR